MSLISTDEFYVQRRVPGTKEYEKARVSVETLEDYILGGYQDGVTDLDDKLNQEIQDRIDGDSELAGQMDGLTDRIRVISNELYDTLVQDEYIYRLDAVSKQNYEVLLANECSGLTGDDLAVCKDTQLDVYHDSVAGNPAADSRGCFYLVTGNYRYDGVTSIFLSDTTNDANTIDLEQATVGSLIEIINVTKSVGGGEIIDNFNYGFYKVTNLGGKYEEMNDTATNLYRFDVEYVGSSPTNPMPSLQDGDNKFLVKLVLDLVSTLNEEYVQLIGDDMTGALNIDVIGDVTGEPENVDGLKTSNNITGAALTLTGYDNTAGDNPTTIDITNTKETTLSFATEEQVYLDFSSNWKVRLKGEDANGDPVAEKLIDYVQQVDVNNPAYIEFNPRLVFVSKAEYLHAPNLIDGSDADNMSIIPPRSYVDYKDQLLSNAIEDVSQRIDTLANASDIYAYRMLLPAESADCLNDLTLGNDTTGGGPGVDYPGYGPNYDPSIIECGRVWAECIRGTIQDLGERGAFEWKPFIDKNYIDPISGATRDRDVDVFVVARESNLIDPPQNTEVSIDWDEQVKKGDYWEVSASDAQTATYAIYRVLETDVNDQGILILEGAPLYKSNEPVQVGQNYKIKVYDKQEGLDPADMYDLFVSKVGDTMSGPLSIATDDGTARKLFEVKTPAGKEIFDVDNNGHVQGRTLRLHNQTIEILEVTEQAEIKVTPYDNVLTLNNMTGSQFLFKSDNFGDMMSVSTTTVDVKTKNIANVKHPTQNDHAVNLGWLTGQEGGSGTLFVTSSDESLEFTKTNQGRLDGKFGKVPISRLADVVIDDPSALKDQVALLWDSNAVDADGNNGAFVPSVDKIAAFIPGRQVAYTGDYPDQNVEVAGLYLNSDTGTLQIRIQ